MIRRALARIPLLETAILIVAFAIVTALTLARQGATPTPTYASYSTYDAGRGGYRAFYELASREGYKTERFEQELTFLDSAIGTLVYAEPSSDDPTAQGSGESEASDLDAWIRAGGTLVYFGHDEKAAKEKIIGQPYTHKASAKAHASHEAATLESSGVEKLGAADGTLRFTPTGKVHTLYDDGRYNARRRTFRRAHRYADRWRNCCAHHGTGSSRGLRRYDFRRRRGAANQSDVPENDRARSTPPKGLRSAWPLAPPTSPTARKRASIA